MTAPYFFIVDADVGGPTSGGWWTALMDEVRRRGFSAEFELGRGPRTATSFVRQALRAGAQTVVAVGSDEIVHDAFNGFLLDGEPVRSDAILAMVPLGLPSAVACNLNLPIGLDALALLADGQSVAIDAGRVRFADAAGPASRYFLSTVTLGLGGQPPRSRALRLVGARAAGIAAILRADGYRGSVGLDDKPAEAVDGGAVIAALGPYGGGGIEVAPRAKLDDGLLDVVVLGRADAYLVAQSVAGRARGLPTLRQLSGRRVRFDPIGQPALRVDGIEVGTGRAEIEVLPGMVKMVVGRP
jgi:diacylglycerol kinase family enzyme